MTKHNLDLLRTVAVVTVLIDHTTLAQGVNFFHGWDLRWLGVFGVYMFFVHTCLVLMWSLERRPHTLDFYVRRVARIYPLAMLVVAFIGATHFTSMCGDDPITKSQLFSNLFLVQNLWSHRNLTGVLWSLPFEVQMYLLLPVFFVFARRERVIWPFLIFWTFFCCTAKDIYGPHFGNNSFYIVIPHFLPGIMAFILYKRWKPVLPAWTFLAFISVLLVFFEAAPNPQRGWLVCLVMGLGLPLFRDFNPGWLTLAGKTIAEYSYGIYLLHPFALYFAFQRLPKVVHLPVWVSYLIALGTLALMVVPAYHLIEKPGIRLGSRLANRLQSRLGTDYSAEHGLELA